MVTMKTWLINILLQKKSIEIFYKKKTFFNKIHRRFAFTIFYWCQIYNKNGVSVMSIDVTVFASIQVTSLNIQISLIRFYQRTQCIWAHPLISFYMLWVKKIFLKVPENPHGGSRTAVTYTFAHRDPLHAGQPLRLAPYCKVLFNHRFEVLPGVAGLWNSRCIIRRLCASRRVHIKTHQFHILALF